MEYWKFSLIFCAIMVLFEWIWIPIALITGFLFNSFARKYKAVKIVYTHMIINNVLYSFFILSSAILLIEKFYLTNSSTGFYVFMIVISLIYFVFFFADKRNNFIKSQERNPIIHTSDFMKITHVQIGIEFISILLYLLILFFPKLIENYLTKNLFDGLYYIATIKVLGVILGIYGLFSLTKYIRVILFSLFLIPLINKKQ